MLESTPQAPNFCLLKHVFSAGLLERIRVVEPGPVSALLGSSVPL